MTIEVFIYTGRKILKKHAKNGSLAVLFYIILIRYTDILYRYA